MNYSVMFNPVLKWAGGKRTLLPDIINLFPADYKERTYHEPFIGGGAVFFKIKPKTGSINDINSRLMNFYRVVKDTPQELISKANKYSYDEKSYYKLRDRFDQPNISTVEKASLLLYLNKTAFNGLYRVNSKGKFNVPFGRYPDNIQILNADNLRNVSECLKNVEITTEDFEESVKDAKEGDFVYFDPPYIPLTDTANFTDYTSKGFGIKEQERLAKVFRELDERGCYVMGSNSDVPKIAELYEGFETKKVHARRFISSDPNGRDGVLESLIINY
ncbi:MAG: DNA adenine methylase [Candidatus Heimdallarchaeota archaeon]|nr:DNA adenine methylase [Candidatus Heimdallarchaeota archaeon]MCK4612736.1 DNA adenine methylase [Candidatus Heimdallarchaeota archaeon]